MVIPHSVTTIEEGAFALCKSLTSVNIPGSVTRIGNDAFSDCKLLTSVNLGEGIREIGDYAFNECISLISVNIPNSVTTIGKETFFLCKSLTSVHFGNDIVTIGESLFSCCPKVAIHNTPWWFNREHVKLAPTTEVRWSRLTIIPRLIPFSEKSSFDFHSYSSYRDIIGHNLTLLMYLIFKRINVRHPKGLPAIPVEAVNLINSFIAVSTTAFPTLDPIPAINIYAALDSLKEVSYKPK